MVYDESEQLRSDQEERRREKFSRERGDPFIADRGGARRGFGTDSGRRDYANGTGRKRPYREDDSGFHSKRSRFDGVDSYEPQFVRKEDPTGAIPQLLTFKKFLATQDESLSDEEAITKYTAYKMEFMRQECERYFQAHKDEEWFRQKYHPEEGKQRREEQRQNLQKRLQVFMELIDGGSFKGISMSYEYAEQLIRLMDTVVIKLEGGSEADIKSAYEELIDDESVLDLLSPKQLEQRNEAKAQEGSQCENKPKNGGIGGGTEEENTDEAVATETMEVEQKPSLKNAPHKTCSIFFRSIPALAPYADLENLCKQHPGFIRLAITNPGPDSKGQKVRSAWATYRWDVNIKEIYWALRTAKLCDQELGASVNRELRRRVRSIGASSGISGHRSIVHNDIRQAAKLIVLYDLKAGFYREEAEEGEDLAQGETQDEDQLADLEATVLKSRNPLLADIANFLVEETGAEEEALVDKAVEVNGGEAVQSMEIDQQMTQMLDRLLFYLRLVHSVDFYAAIEYSSEDEMPHRLGLIHVRDRPPSKQQNWPCTDRDIPLLSKRLIDAHIQTFNSRLESTLIKKVVVPESELQQLGKKDAEKAVQDFINTNTVQLGPEKWSCPLSGKKFKGAEFVHKHLYSKYQTEMDNARFDSLYFNNFLADPNRPHNPIFAKPTSGKVERGRSPSPSPLRPRHSSGAAEESSGGGVGGRQVAEASERPSYQRNNWQSMDRGFSGGGGGNRFGGGGGNRFGGSFGNTGFGGGRPARFNEPMNEMMMVPGGRGGSIGGAKQDPRAPPSYRDLDAPTEDIF